jgi:hypothetical protein
MRIRFGVGHALVQSFGAAQWRIVFGVEMFGHSRSHYRKPTICEQLHDRSGKTLSLEDNPDHEGFRATVDRLFWTLLRDVGASIRAGR